jgi:hypothetical protein
MDSVRDYSDFWTVDAMVQLIVRTFPQLLLSQYPTPIVLTLVWLLRRGSLWHVAALAVLEQRCVCCFGLRCFAVRC